MDTTTCDDCDDEICDECGGCSCPDSQCGGQYAHNHSPED